MSHEPHEPQWGDFLRRRNWEYRAAKRMLIAIVVLTLLAALMLCVGCAPRSLSDTPSVVEAERLPLGIWRSTSIEAARAIASGDTALARRLNIALARDIYAAQQRFSAAAPVDPVASRAGSTPIDKPDATKPTLERAAEALGELFGGDK